MMILIRKNGGVELIRFADNNSFAFSLSVSLSIKMGPRFICLFANQIRPIFDYQLGTN